MKQLTNVGFDVLTNAVGNAGQEQRTAVDQLLAQLPEDVRQGVDYAIGEYGLSVAKAAFVAGLTVASDPVKWLVA